MATTFVEYTGDGNATKQFTFPSYQESDVKVRVDGVLKTTSTHYNITGYTTTGGGNVVFTSGNIPSSPANIRIYRDTNVDAAKATFTAGSSVKAADLNNNTTQLLYRAQEEQIPNLIHSYDIDDSAIETSKIKADAVTGAKIADDSINSEHYVDGSIDTAHIADAQITTAKLAADSVTGAKIADDQINSEHYVDGSIDTAHIADAQITTGKVADGAITSAKLASGTVATGDLADGLISTAKIAADAVTNAKIADDSIDSEHYVDGSIDTAHIGNLQVTTAKIAADAVDGTKIADDSINSEHYVDGSIDTAHIADSQITAAKIASNAVTTAKIADDAVTTAKIAENAVTNVELAVATVVSTNIANGNILTDKIANDAVTNAKIADDSIDSEHYVDGSIDTAHIGDSQITSAKIANNAVTTDKIADSELSTLAGMQSGTASKLADSTALTADLADLNQLDGMAKQTTITNDDTKFPTSGAIVDYVAAQLEPFGGFEAIANESSFPNTQPASGVVISIADAGGMAVSGSGTASGATVGGTTVNITGIASNFNGTTVDTGVRFLVVSTGSGQNYTYHKATLKEDDLLNLSGDINDFSERYRVGSSNPTTGLDNGDLFFNTGSGKLLVYNGTNAAWEETQTVGNFFINTISSSSSTGGGSATPNGTAYRFTLSNAGTFAQQHLVSVDGVVQKPNSGTSQPSEGFAIDGADIIFGSAPVSGASLFVITIGASVSIGTPSNNTVTTAILQNGSVTTAKIVDANVTTAKIANDAVNGTKIADNSIDSEHYVDESIDTTHIGNLQVTTPKIGSDAVTTAKIADDAVTAAKLADSSVTAGSYGSATAIPAITVDAKGRITAATTNSVNTTTNLSVVTSTGSVTVASSTGTNASIAQASSSAAGVMSTTHHDKLDGIATSATANPNAIDNVVEDTSPNLGGTLSTNGHSIHVLDNNKIKYGTGDDLEIYHDGSNSFIKDSGTGSLVIQASTLAVNNAAGNEQMMKAVQDGAVELNYNGSKKLETNNDGIVLSGDINLGSGTLFTNDNGKLRLGGGQDLELYHDGSHSYLDNTGGVFHLRSVDDVKIQTNTSELAIKCDANGAVELYNNGNLQMMTIDGGINLQDNKNAEFGNSGDLKIFHDGSHSKISNSTGYLVERSNQYKLSNLAEDHTYIKVPTHQGGVELYYDNVKKLETTSTGAAINGGRMTSSQPMAAYYGCNNTSGYAGWKTIQWRVQEDRDNINISNSNSRFTPQVAGWYSCVFNHYHSNGTHSSYYLEIKVYPGSGGSYTPAYQKYPDNFSANISSIIYFNGSSDYVEFRTHHSNTAHNTEDSYLTNMRMVYLSN